ncbi:hypothetical protein ACF1BE_22485 [Streptomyces sp. NPDC014991]|uniref:hypothetical protein n=1 Tax=Streptomyces sp. NPDC014991 TaxID=3364935 RepID=UPI0036F7DE1A
MSSGFAIPTIQTVAPAVQFAPPPPPLDPQALPHTGLLHLHDTAGQASAHLADAAGHAAHQAADAALQVLGSLSGVLLVGRAALLGTRVLAAAAVRAAEEQRCLERQQRLAADAAAQWEAAAFAAVRLNARRGALLARVARAAAHGGPPGPPPRPDVPPPLAPVGERLGDLRQRTAHAEEALRRAEARQAAWEQQRLTAELRLDDEQEDDWRRGLRESRQRTLQRFSAERTAETEARQMPRQTTDRRTPAALDPDEVRRTGADILGTLDPYAAVETAELAADAVRHAVRRAADDPRRARIHLTEARKFVRDANKRARETREAQERAALHHDFLVYETPEGAEDLAPAPDAVTLLRRTLDNGDPLTPDERALVERRVEERLHALEAVYVRQQCADAVAELARTFGGRAGAGRPDGQEIRLDWTPEGWEPGHWLRATLVDGALRVATMYRGTPGERTCEERAVDDLRCAETRERLTRFEEIAGGLGLDLAFTAEHTEGALPGVLGEDAWVLDGLLDEAVTRPADVRRDVPGEAPRHRTVDGDRRR